MRFIKYALMLIVAIVAVSIAVANRDLVTLSLLPVALELPFTTSVTVPLFVALLAAVFLGVAIGMALEMSRERFHRKAERDFKRHAARLNREVQRLSQKAGEEDDDILGVKHG